ncbi:MAG: TonB family protein [Rhodanobacteraceae bacterium]
MYAHAVSPQGWEELSDTDQYRLWITFVPVKNPPLGMVVSLKTAEKGVDGSVTNISIVSVNAVCGANGSAPNYVQMGMSASFGEHGPIAGDAGGPTVRLVPDTNLAVAVQRACKKVRAPIAKTVSRPASGKCSIPRPDYPISAMRQNKQGVATVAFDVTGDGHTAGLSVLSSSGSTDLDNAAMDAVSRGTCTVTPGSRLSTAITFSLQH